MSDTREFRVNAEDIKLLERIYGATVRFHDRKQVMICTYCRAQRAFHHSDCPFRAFGILIDRLHIQESEGSISDAEV